MDPESDEKKIPTISSQAQEIQRVEVYLKDLKERLYQLREQHDEVIQNSVDIIKEIDEISTTFPMNSKQTEISKIKRIVREFEMNKECNTIKSCTEIENRINFKEILRNFEKLNESQILKSSLVLFKQAKESFEQIETILIRDKIKIHPPVLGPNIQNKIQIFSSYKNLSNSSRSMDSSDISISVQNNENENATEDETKSLSTTLKSTSSALDRGYEGDNDDSEYDLTERSNANKNM